MVAEAAERTGGVDALLNTPGYGLSGGVEELGEQQARDQLDVNLFGALWVTEAVLPVMRRQGGGHILHMSSIAGIATCPNLGLYCASKWALEGLSEALAQEVAGFGIRVTLVEPGEFRTDWSAGSMVRATPMPEYDEVLAARRHGMSGAYAHLQPGDPPQGGRGAAQARRRRRAAAAPPARDERRRPRPVPAARAARGAGTLGRPGPHHGPRPVSTTTAPTRVPHPTPSPSRPPRRRPGEGGPGWLTCVRPGALGVFAFVQAALVALVAYGYTVTRDQTGDHMWWHGGGAHGQTAGGQGGVGAYLGLAAVALYLLALTAAGASARRVGGRTRRTAGGSDLADRLAFVVLAALAAAAWSEAATVLRYCLASNLLLAACVGGPRAAGRADRTPKEREERC
ncbi:SDR family NAD(P)-dependent oxidoreductase [Streptomyces sp. GSL17-111]|uniref:SDR family NAD(P)-dependent oxidoreductase n=1 Tax=Streptomyces sp. GSL17-111 TaxID=3121596 RepID=UPI0030F41702